MNIRFSPTLSDEDIRREAVNLIVADLERKAAEEQQVTIEQDKDVAPQEIQVSTLFLVHFSHLFTFCCQVSVYANGIV